MKFCESFPATWARKLNSNFSMPPKIRKRVQKPLKQDFKSKMAPQGGAYVHSSPPRGKKNTFVIINDMKLLVKLFFIAIRISWKIFFVKINF